MFPSHKKLLIALCLGMGATMGCLPCEALASNGSAQPSSGVQFDTSVLEARGFSADVATFFARGMRFLPGVQQVGINVNAGRRQVYDVRFDGEGKPCFTPGLLRQLTLRVPGDLEQDACGNPEQLFPGAHVELKPASMQVSLVVPDEAFDPDTREGAAQRGGRAAILNYNVFTQRFQGNGASQTYLQAQIEPGFNIDNWVFRSRGNYSKGQAWSGYQQQSAYAQRNVESMNSLLQMGSIPTASDIYGGMPIYGAQLFSDSAQLGATMLVVPIQGIASSNAVIELRQRGQVVYRTVVMPGPYSLAEVPGLSSGTDIEVQVTEEDGRVSRYTVPAPMSNGPVNQPTTYHLGVGRYHNEFLGTNISRSPWLAYGDYSFNISPNLRFSGGALLAQGYQSTSAQTTLGVGDNAWVAAGLRTSHAPQRGLGHEFQLQGSALLGSNLYGSLSWLSRSNRFASLEDTITNGGDGLPARQQTLSASLSWSHMKWGAFSYSATRSSDAYGSDLTHTLTAGRSLGRTMLTASAQKNSKGSAIYLNANMPLGKSSLNTRFYQYANGTQSLAALYQGRAGPDFNYQLDASKSGDTTRGSASAQMRTAYAQLSGGVSQAGQGLSSFYGSAVGSLVLTGDRTLATAAGNVGDTFAVVKVPQMSGLRLNAPGGGAKVSALGTAVLPNLYPYQTAHAQVDGKSLPLNVRLDNTRLEMNLARGTVATRTISATQVRQLMLQVKLPDDSFATVGTIVLNEHGDFMGTVIGEGNVVLVNDDIGKPVYLEATGKPRCQIEYQAPPKFDPEMPYEEAPATCS